MNAFHVFAAPTDAATPMMVGSTMTPVISTVRGGQSAAAGRRF